MLDALPRLGLVQAASPVTALPELAATLGLEWLGIKRDDLLPALNGGSKARKLDYLLADPAFAAPKQLRSSGAIGSGHLAALSLALQSQGRALEAHCFWEPVSGNVLENLAHTVSACGTLEFHGSRVQMALRAPRLLLEGDGKTGVVPPGGSTVSGMLGIVHGALELAAQVREGVLPEPERIVVALGSGGTAVGLAIGLGLAGLSSQVHAVTAVERLLSTRRRLTRLTEALRARLHTLGLACEPRPLHLDRSAIGPGYGIPSAASLAACERLLTHAIDLEPIYTGKAFASVLAGRVRGRRVLIWLTRQRPTSPPEDWRERLPEALRRRL
jgi:D-cysteine desulfhydrase